MASASGLGGVNRVENVIEKGSKGFVVQTVCVCPDHESQQQADLLQPTQSDTYLAESTALRDRWLAAIKQVAA